MSEKVRVTLLPAHYMQGRKRYTKGWNRVFDSDDPALQPYINNRYFKVESATARPRAKLLPGVKLPNVVEPTPQPVNSQEDGATGSGKGSSEDDPTSDLTKVLDKRLVALLVSGGYDSIEQVKAAGEEQLQQVTGIGEVLSAQMYKACNEYDPEEDDPTGESKGDK